VADYKVSWQVSVCVCVGDVGGFMGLLLGGSVLTVFELIDLIVFRFVNTVFGAKQEKQDADGSEAAEGGMLPGAKAQSPRSPPERPVSAVATINTPQRRIRRVAKYQPAGADKPPASADKPPTPVHGGRPALVIVTGSTPAPDGGLISQLLYKRCRLLYARLHYSIY